LVKTTQGRKAFVSKLKNMNEKLRWFLIETELGYNQSIERYEQIRDTKTEAEFEEKLLPVHLIET